MTNSKDQDRIKAEIIIDDLFRMTDEQCIQKKIDQPIEKAASNYTFDQTKSITHQSFNNIICDFVTHVFNQGDFLKMTSKTMAVAEAMAIVEIGYQGSQKGYDGALLDAMNPSINGVEHVLQQIKEIIISILRQKYIQWVYNTQILPLDWNKKSIIAEILSDQYKPHFLLKTQTISPGQLVDCIPELIKAIQESTIIARRSMGGKQYKNYINLLNIKE
jgi:hypothetical protein